MDGTGSWLCRGLHLVVALQTLSECLFTDEAPIQVAPMLQLCWLTQLAKGQETLLSPWAGSSLAQSCAVPCPGRLEFCTGSTVLSKCQSCKLSA